MKRTFLLLTESYSILENRYFLSGASAPPDDHNTSGYIPIIIENTFGAINAMLKKRYDLIPNMVEIVKQYANYEYDTFVELTGLWTAFYAQMIKLNSTGIFLC